MQTEVIRPTWSDWRDYIELCKPKVVALMLLTMLVGMFLSVPGTIPLSLVAFSLLGVGLAASSAAAINHLVDRRIDAIMNRTKKRPIAQGRVNTLQAIVFATTIGVFGLGILAIEVNALTAILTFATLIGYAGIYTGYLKRATPQNIVIGGLAGAAPPLLGWTAITNQMDPQALLLVLIIFTWTPPHFWALAIYRYEDYKNAEIPMLPVTHGLAFTRMSIFLYTWLLLTVSLLPYVVGMSGYIYLGGAVLLGCRFLQWAWRMLRNDKPVIAMQTFRFSIVYLMVLFVLLLVDHYL